MSYNRTIYHIKAKERIIISRLTVPQKFPKNYNIHFVSKFMIKNWPIHHVNVDSQVYKFLIIVWWRSMCILMLKKFTWHVMCQLMLMCYSWINFDVPHKYFLTIEIGIVKVFELYKTRTISDNEIELYCYFEHYLKCFLHFHQNLTYD